MVKRLSQNAIARALGMSSANMVKMKKQGCPMDSVEAVQKWRAENQNIAARKVTPKVSSESTTIPQRSTGNSSPPSLTTNTPVSGYEQPQGFEETHQEARTRREIAEANLAEIKESEERGDLIRVDTVKAALANAFSSTRDALLQLPARLAPLLAAETDTGATQALLHAEIHQALQLLSGASDRMGVVK